MPAILTRQEAIDAIHQTISDNSDGDPPFNMGLAEGIYGGILVGYGMDETAFLAVHSRRLAHLTREAMQRMGRALPPLPGAMPTNI